MSSSRVPAVEVLERHDLVARAEEREEGRRYRPHPRREDPGALRPLESAERVPPRPRASGSRRACSGRPSRPGPRPRTARGIGTWRSGRSGAPRPRRSLGPPRPVDEARRHAAPLRERVERRSVVFGQRAIAGFRRAHRTTRFAGRGRTPGEEAKAFLGVELVEVPRHGRAARALAIAPPRGSPPGTRAPSNCARSTSAGLSTRKPARSKRLCVSGLFV